MLNKKWHFSRLDAKKKKNNQALRKVRFVTNVRECSGRYIVPIRRRHLSLKWQSSEWFPRKIWRPYIFLRRPGFNWPARLYESTSWKNTIPSGLFGRKNVSRWGNIKSRLQKMRLFDTFVALNLNYVPKSSKIWTIESNCTALADSSLIFLSK